MSNPKYRSERELVQSAKHAVIEVPSSKILNSISDLEDAAIDLEEKRWEAIEWARAQGIKLLGDPHE